MRCETHAIEREWNDMTKHTRSLVHVAVVFTNDRAL
jgi:hypothetical protein